MALTEDHFLSTVDQMLSRPNARQLLEALAKESDDQFQNHFALGFAYRVEAVTPGLLPPIKAGLYAKAADAFATAARNATTAVRSVAEARQFENEAFASITEAGYTKDPHKRITLYEKSSLVLIDALVRLPERYKKTRSHLLGWQELCRAKANGIAADQITDSSSKSIAHAESARLFAKSAEHFREAGQESLAQVSVAWRSFSSGWSSYFAGEPSHASEQFRSALTTFRDCGRSDLVAACLPCLQAIGLETGAEDGARMEYAGSKE